MKIISQEEWNACKAKAESECPHPESHNRMRSEWIDWRTYNLAKAESTEVPDMCLQPGDMFVRRISKNFGTKKWPDMRPMNDFVQVLSIGTKMIIGTCGERTYKDDNTIIIIYQDL